jgi:hypothetical protein
MCGESHRMIQAFLTTPHETGCRKSSATTQPALRTLRQTHPCRGGYRGSGGRRPYLQHSALSLPRASGEQPLHTKPPAPHARLSGPQGPKIGSGSSDARSARQPRSRPGRNSSQPHSIPSHRTAFSHVVRLPRWRDGKDWAGVGARSTSTREERRPPEAVRASRCSAGPRRVGSWRRRTAGAWRGQGCRPTRVSFVRGSDIRPIPQRPRSYSRRFSASLTTIATAAMGLHFR